MRSILPQDNAFYDDFDKICQKVVEAAEALKVMLDEGGSYDRHASRIKSIESEADEVVHHAVEHLHKTFVTPLDRQDILKLTSRLDDIADLVEAAASRIRLYKPKQMCIEAKDLAEVTLQSSRQVAELVRQLRNLKKQAAGIKTAAMEIDRLENVADDIRRKGIARLFEEEQDARELIKWKDIIEHIEAATDRCEDVSDIVEGILLENT